MTATATPLMARLAQHRTQAGVTQTAIAAHLGVNRATVSRWETGQRSPHYLYAVGYAHLLGDQIILHDGQHVLAAGTDIPAALPNFRQAAGLTTRQYARRLRIIPIAVNAAERRGYQLLSSYERAVRGLDLVIDLQATTRSGVAA